MPSDQPPDDQGFADAPALCSAYRHVVRAAPVHSTRDGWSPACADDDPFLAPDIDSAYAPVALREAMATLHAGLPDRIEALIATGRGVPRDRDTWADALSIAGLVEGDRLTVTVAPMGRGRVALSRNGRTGASACTAGLNCARAVQWASILTVA
jgi:hypothetical protein